MEIFEQFFIKVYEAMFENKCSPLLQRDEVTGSFTTNKIYIITIDINKLFNIKNSQPAYLKFIEQNKNKNSSYAERARAGAEIMWIIASVGDKEKWLGRVENRIWYPK